LGHKIKNVGRGYHTLQRHEKKPPSFTNNAPLAQVSFGIFVFLKLGVGLKVFHHYSLTCEGRRHIKQKMLKFGQSFVAKEMPSHIDMKL